MNKTVLLFWISPVILIISYYLIGLLKSEHILRANHTNTRFHFLKLLIRKVYRGFHKLTVIDTIALGIFFVFICFYIFLIFYQENFSGVDESNLILYTLKGKLFPNSLEWSNGRFAPLLMQEFNIISLLTQSAGGYHAFPVLQLLVVLAGIFIILKSLPIWLRVCVAITLLITPSFLLPFFGLVYPERNVIFWLVIFIICFQLSFQANQTRSRFFFCCTLIAAQFLLYYKEVAFLLIGGFAIFRLLEDIIKRNIIKQKLYRQFLRIHLLEILLLALSGLFLIGYIKFILLNFHGANYAQKYSTSSFYALIYYIKADLLLSIFLITFGLRCIHLIFSKRNPDLLWDPLAFGALLYYLIYLKLGLTGNYYMSPVDFIAVLYLSQLVYYPFFKNRKIVVRITISLIFMTVATWNSLFSLHMIALVKNNMLGQAQLYNFLDSYLNDHPSNYVHLFFPTDPNISQQELSGSLVAPTIHRGFDIYELGLFLEHKELAVVKRKSSKPSDGVFKHPSTLIFKSSYPYDKGLCVSWDEYECLYAQSPKPGDLIIVTPRLPISVEKLKIFEQEATLLFHYRNRFPSLFFVSDTYVFRKL